MILLQTFHGYHLLIPNQYHRSECLRSFDTLEKLFYLEGHPLYYRKSFRDFSIYRQGQYYELRLRGCLVREGKLNTLDQWLYIDTEGDHSHSISQLLLDYLPNRSKIRHLVMGRDNQYFYLMPLQCIFQFLIGISFEAFKQEVQWLVKVASLTYLDSTPLIKSQQLTVYYAGFRFNQYCQRFLINQTVYFYEELQLFDWWLIAKLPYMCEEDVRRLQALFYKETSLEQTPSS